MEVTLTARLRSGILLEAARKCGSNRALAERLGVGEAEVGKWINLQKVPAAKTIEARWAEWEIALYEILGRVVEIDSVFPPGLRERLAGHPVTVFESTADVAPERLSIAPSAPMLLAGEELKSQTLAALEVLSPMKRRILKKRFGLDGNDPMTLDEVAAAVGRSRERIRYLEAKAMSDLRCAATASAALRDAGATTERRAANAAARYLREVDAVEE